MKRIQPLPADVRAYVRTGVALTSFAQAVEELVLNSIDAGASSVAVRVDLACFRIQVVDNGQGISFEQFKLIGERYSTSKCHSIEDLDNLKYFGYRGEALASLRTAASFLEIVSRSKSSLITYSKCFQNGAALGVIQASLPRPSVGTTITAHDLLYNLPVRRKRVNSVLEMEKIRYRMAGIALVWPHVSFSLRDDSAGHVILQTYKCSGMATSFSYIFTPARARGLMEVAAERDEFKLTGLVGKETYSRMDLQFVFINRRLVLKSSIHRQINKILSRSLILRRKGLTNDMLEKNVIAGATSTGSPQKQLERFAIFVINVECPYSAYDITFDPSKTLVEFQDWPKLIHLLQDMLYGFLRKENLMSITEPVSSNLPCDVNDDDEIDEEDNDASCQNNSHSETSLSNEQEDARINVSLGSVHRSTFLENSLFSKTVYRPKNQITVKAIVSEEQTKSMANSCGECQDLSLSEQLQNNPSSGKTAVLNVNQQNNGACKSIFNTSHPINAANCHQKPVQIYSHSESVLTSQEDSEPKTKQFCHENAPSKSKWQGGDQSSLLHQHSSHSKTMAKPCFQATKHSLCEDSEEVIIKKPALSKRSEITLGNSVQYSSTLKNLRDMNQTSSSSKVAEIITNTLQQLRCATQTSVKNLGDLYKTPKKSTISVNGSLISTNHSKMENVKIADNVLTTSRNVSNTDACMQNRELRTSIPHNYNLIQAPRNQLCEKNIAVLDKNISLSSKSKSSATFRSTKEDRSLGESDRGNVQKRPSCHNTSHASKLAKLMKGKSVEEHQDICDKDSVRTDSMKYTKILNAFNYNKLKKNNLCKLIDTKTDFISSSCVPSESLKEYDQTINTPFSGDPLKWSIDIAAQHLVSKRGKETAGDSDTRRWNLSMPSSSKTKQLCSKATCNRCCCCLTTHQTRGQFGQLGDSLPFSIYKAANTLKNGESENSKTPKVSVILSLPLDDSESNSSHVKNLDRFGQDKSALLSNQKINIHTDNINPGHSMVKVNVSESAVSIPFHNHHKSNKNKDNKVQNKANESNHSPGESLRKSELIFTRDSLVEDHLKIISEPEAGSCGSSPSTPQLSQGFTVTTTQLDKDNSDSSSDDLGSAAKLHDKNSAQNIKSPNRFESSGFSPTNEVSSSSPERSSPWTQLHLKTSGHCLQSKVTVSPGASNKYLTLSDSDTDIYIQNRNNTESIQTSADNLYCEETLSSQDTDFDDQVQKDTEVTLAHGNSHSVLASSAMSDKPNTDIDNVVENTQDEHNCFPATVCSTTPESKGKEPNKKPMCQTNEAFHYPNSCSIQVIEDVVRGKVDSNIVPETAGELVDDISSNGDKENVLINLNYEDKGGFSEITNMISDAKQMFQNMREFLDSSVSTQDPFMPSFNIEKVSAPKSHHGQIFDHSRSSQYFPEKVPVNTCDNLPGPGVQSPRTSTENHEIYCELPQLPETVEKDTFQSSSRSGLHVDIKTCRSENISNLNTELSLFEVITSDPSQQDTELEVCDGNCTSLKDGLNLCAAQPQRGSHSLKLQSCTTISKNLNEEALGHIVSCVDEKVAVQRPEFLYCEAKSDNYDCESKEEFTEVKHKHTQIQNTCKNPTMLDIEDHLQVHKPSHFVAKSHTDSETDQADMMSSEGDQVLMLIHESDLSPGDIPHRAERSSEVNNLTINESLSLEKANCLATSEDMSLDKVSSEIRQSNDSVEAAYTNGTVMNNCGVADTVRYHASSSEIGLSHFDAVASNSSDPLGNFQSILVSSSLSLIRPDGQTEGTCKMFHPERVMHQGDVSSADNGASVEILLSTTDQNPLSVTQATSNVEKNTGQDIQMKENSSKDKRMMVIDTQQNKTGDECQEETTETACWKEVVDLETGTRTFVSNLSGHTVTEEQWEQLSSQTQKEMLNIHSEGVAIPAVNGPTVFSDMEKQAFKDLVTNHFEQEENEALSKWRKGERPAYGSLVYHAESTSHNDIRLLFDILGTLDTNVEADISTLIAKWTNPVFLNYKQPGLLADSCPSDTVTRSCFNSLSSVEFTKNILDQVKVIGQLDNKFIVSLIDNPESCSKATRPQCSSLLVLFDQHAVHERIRLEHFTKECYEAEGGERSDRIKRLEIKPAQSITMDQDDLRIMKAFSIEFSRIGINFSVEKTSRNTVHITSLPLCLIEKDASDLKKNKVESVIEIVENLIKEHIELLKSTNGACGRLPLTIHKVLCSQACHGAIKFGDKLTIQECQDLLSSLASCNLPFQCAHGRPSLAPLVNLDAVERELLSTRRPPNLWKISQHFKH